MPIEFQCPSCGGMLRVPDDSAGKRAKCPQCANVTEVPATSSWPAGLRPATAARVNQTDGTGTSPAPLQADPNNPYAAPQHTGVIEEGFGTTSGPPWEQFGPSPKAYFATLGLIYGNPNKMFSEMRQRGGIAMPLFFGVLAYMLFGTIGFIVTTMMSGRIEPIMLAIAPLAFAISAALSIFIFSGMLHLTLMMFRVANTFQTTFRIVSYSAGASVVLLLIPFVGSVVVTLIGAIFNVIGVSKALKISIINAVGLVLLPGMICFFGLLGLIMLLLKAFVPIC